MPTYTLQQRIFMYDSYVITSSCREVVRHFQANYPGVRVPSREAVRLFVNKVYKTNPHTLDELKLSIRTEINAISEAELMRVNANFLRRCRRCIDAEGHHFQHPL